MESVQQIEQVADLLVYLRWMSHLGATVDRVVIAPADATDVPAARFVDGRCLSLRDLQQPGVMLLPGGRIDRPARLRHTFASSMIAAGVDFKKLSTFMGHSSVQITLDRYGHLLPGDEADSAARLDAYLAAARG